MSILNFVDFLYEGSQSQIVERIPINAFLDRVKSGNIKVSNRSSLHKIIELNKFSCQKCMEKAIYAELHKTVFKQNWGFFTKDGEQLTIDHIYPTDLGGIDEMSNYQVLCRKCNSMKANYIDYLYCGIDKQIFRSLIKDNVLRLKNNVIFTDDVDGVYDIYYKYNNHIDKHGYYLIRAVNNPNVFKKISKFNFLPIKNEISLDIIEVKHGDRWIKI